MREPARGRWRIGMRSWARAAAPLTVTGPIEVNEFGENGYSDVVIGTGGDVTFAGPVAGAGIELSGGGTLRLAHANPFLGRITVSRSVLNIVTGAAAPAIVDTFGGGHGTGAVVLSPGVVVGESSTLQLAGQGINNQGALSMLGPGDSTWGGTVSVDSNSSVRADAGATLWVTGPITSNGTRTLEKIGAGDLLLAPELSFGTLLVSQGAVRVLPTNSGIGRVNRLTSLLLAGSSTPTATFDLNEHTLIVTQPSVPTLTAQIVQARNQGKWDQHGLTSSVAAVNPDASTTLGLLTGAEYISIYGPGATIGGFVIAGSDAIVKHTYYGDTDFNGVIDGDDYARIDNGFNLGLGGWLNGDSDLNGVIDGDDYALIDHAFNTQDGTLRRAVGFLSGQGSTNDDMNTAALDTVRQHFERFGVDYAQAFLASVPEPAGAPMSLLPVAGTLARWRRRRRAGAQSLR
jgi:hypothetical protein